MNNLFYFWFFKKIDEITQNKLITVEQKENIREYYKGKQSGSIFNFSSIISLFGAILIGAGVILFISANWEELGRWTKFSIVNGFMILSYSTGFFLYNYTDKKKTGQSLIFLGTIVFGASIFLVAQIFNIQSKYYNGLLTWGLLIIPFIFLFRNRIFILFPMIILYSWNLMLTNKFNTLNLYNLIFLIFFVFLSYKRKSAFIMNASILSFLSWLLFTYVRFFKFNREDITTSMLFLAVGIIFFVLSKDKGINKGLFINTFKFWNYFLVFFSMFSISHNRVISKMLTIFNKNDLNAGMMNLAVVFLVFTFIWFLYSVKKMSYSPLFYVSQSLMFIFYAILKIFNMNFFPETIVFIVLNFNLLYFTIETIRVNVREKNVTFINIGIIFFIIHFITRYFDYAYKYLPRGFYFFVTGLILIIISVIIEKKRRRIIEMIREEK